MRWRLSICGLILSAGFGAVQAHSQAASQTGGRVFKADDSDAAIYEDLRTIELDLRDQYRLIYKPVDLEHNGSFHRIALKRPKRVESIVIRSGYYAPTR